MAIADYISALLASPFGAQVTHHRILPEQEAVHAKPKKPWSKAVQNILEAQDIAELFLHQAKATDHIRSGRDVVVATPTASGKSLIYHLPVLESHVHDPEARALYVFPLKALSQDQKASFEKMVQPWPKEARPSIAIYDGDTTSHFRRKLRLQPPSVLITTPEMLHLGILPHHEQWTTFFAGLQHVVIDEAHTYRGVLGAHMAQLLQRLRRIVARYGGRPCHILSTATVGNAAELGSQLVGLASLQAKHTPKAAAPVVIDQSGAPQGNRHFVFLNPYDSPNSAAIGLLKSALARNLRTIVYCRSRRMTELLALWATGNNADNPHKGRIAAYRAGFLPEERRHIEAKMHSGELLAIISTSALELGIDIGGLDLCILVGYPGTVMSTLQRGGRVGRAKQDSAVILVASEDALDQYIVRHAEDFFKRRAEDVIINIDNEVILQQHLECAAAEIPLRPVNYDAPWLQRPPAQVALQMLVEQGLLLQSADGKEYMAARKRPQRHVDMRGSGATFSIEDEDGRIIGTVDGMRALKETHPGAVYLHRGKSYEITSLDLTAHRSKAKQAKVKWYTRVRTQKSTEILHVQAEKTLGCTQVFWGRLRITELITGYEKRATHGNNLLSIIPLDFPPQVFETEGLWIVVPHAVRHVLEENFVHFMGAIHALEHAAIAMLPLQVMADRNDFGGISTPLHPQVGLPAVFIYDALPGGAGLCRHAYTEAEKLFRSTQESIEGCACEDGCPSCVHSPKCGSGNRPISKVGALELLRLLWSMPWDAQDKIAIDVQPVVQKNSFEKADSYMVLDVETRRSAAEVGGWHKAKDMGVSVVVLYDSKTDTFTAYTQDNLAELFEKLRTCPCIVGFNISRFDYAVLQPFAPYDLQSLPTVDMLQKVKEKLSYRVSLDNIAKATLGEEKSADGLQALQWWKEGKLDLIQEYCQKDVDITKRIYAYGLEHGYVLFSNKAAKAVRVPLDFTLSAHDSR